MRTETITHRFTWEYKSQWCDVAIVRRQPGGEAIRFFKDGTYKENGLGAKACAKRMNEAAP